MKVNLQFSVDIDRVPAELQRLISQAGDKLAELAQDLKFIDAVDGNPYYVNKQVDEVRKSFVAIDNSLEEIQKLVVDYQGALTQLMAEPSLEQELMPLADAVEGWDKTLSEMREQLGGEDDSKQDEER
tara:strand:+ start:2163 stop:2546 length:384 start_codon:yes stop_codon:yes gene_type:complete